MTGKERMTAALSGRVPEEIPVTPHWWGLYKFQLGGLLNNYDKEKEAWSCSLEDLIRYDERFIQTFDPDMLHLTTMAGKRKLSSEETAEILSLRKEASDLESKAKIDRYIDSIYQTTEQVIENGELEHISYHSRKYGAEKLIALNEGSDTACFFDTHVGFENGLIGMMENPENVQYYLRRLYDRTFQRMKAYRQLGGQAFINSETYCSRDIMSPQLYREVIFPVQLEFYTKLRELGILPICYFTGDILPLIDTIKMLPINGLMVEASKKGFSVDTGEIADRLENKIALFGNLESHYILETGTAGEVKNETIRQLQKTKGHPFIMANDCPISFHTPPENIHCMIDTARNYRF